MANKHNKDAEYRSERDTGSSKQTGNSAARNNNTSISTPGPVDTSIETASVEGIGNKAISDRKLTDHSFNHSADA